MISWFEQDIECSSTTRHRVNLVGRLTNWLKRLEGGGGLVWRISSSDEGRSSS
jgi:hypothetical protein